MPLLTSGQKHYELTYFFYLQIGYVQHVERRGEEEEEEKDESDKEENDERREILSGTNGKRDATRYTKKKSGYDDEELVERLFLACTYEKCYK